MKLKSMLVAVGAYLLWGTQALYWQFLNGVDTMVVLAARIVFSAVITVLLLLIRGRIRELGRVMGDRGTRRWMILAALFITLNWGLYSYLVGRGRYLDTALGYYINPLLSIAFGVLVFHERCGKMDILAICLAAAGVLFSAVRFGRAPGYSILIALLFSTYGAIQKRARVDAVTAIAIETLLMTPAALLYVALSPAGQAVLSTLTLRSGLLLVGAGPFTAAPLLLYAKGINELPLSTMGILQFLSPTLQMLVGAVFLGEAFTADKAVVFCFVAAAVTVYIAGVLLRERRGRRTAA